MAESLLILAPRIGAASETFVGRHINGLWPQQTRVIAREVVPEAMWESSVPVDIIGGRSRVPYGSRRWRLAQRARRPASTLPKPPKLGLRLAIQSALDEMARPAVLAEFLDVWTPLILSQSFGSQTIVIRAHGYDVSQRLQRESWRTAYRAVCKSSSIAAVSEYSKALLLDAGLPEDRVHVIPNGVDLPQSVSYERDLTSPVILVVGRLVEKKDPTPVLHAASRLRREGFELKVNILGGGPLRSRLERLVRDLGMGNCVSFRGVVSHGTVLEELERAAVLVQHSTRTRSGDEEGLPLTVLEAMAAGVPVIGTRHAGITEVLSGGAGVLVAERDVDEIARQLAGLLTDEDLRRSVGVAGRQRVSEEYSWSRERDALLRLLDLREPQC